MYFDVVVAGGGVAGIAAAVEAARCGKSVAIIEKTTQLGGLATNGIVNYFEPLCNGRGTQIIRGLPEEFLHLAIRYGFDTLPEEWKNGEPGQGTTNRRCVSKFSAPIFSLTLCELLHNHNVTIFFDTIVTGVDAVQGHIHALHIFNKSGHNKIEGKIFVDTTGDADVLHFTGVPTRKRGNYHTYAGLHTSLEHCKKVLETGDIANLLTDKCAGDAGLTGVRHPEGKPLWDGTDGKQVSQYLIENQLQLLENIKGDDRKTRDITLLPIIPQFRTTRCIEGNATFREEHRYQHFQDSVCAIIDFTRRDVLYEVPYGVLVKDGFDNVITAGRSVSAEGFGWDIIRVIPNAIMTGQVAGAAASQAIETNTAITGIDIDLLQTHLADETVSIHFDDKLIPQNVE